MKLDVLKPNETITSDLLDSHPNRYFSFNWMKHTFLFYIFEVEGNYLNCLVNVPQNILFIEGSDDKVTADGKPILEVVKEKFIFETEKIDEINIDSQGKSKEQLAMVMLQSTVKYVPKK